MKKLLEYLKEIREQDKYFFVTVIDKRGVKKFLNSDGSFAVATNTIRKFKNKKEAEQFIIANDLKLNYQDVRVESK